MIHLSPAQLAVSFHWEEELVPPGCLCFCQCAKELCTWAALLCRVRLLDRN